MKDSAVSLTTILREIADGKDHSLARLMPLVYDELRRLAALHLRTERADHTLQPTALVHEAYLLLLKQEKGVARPCAVFSSGRPDDERVLVDYARQHHRAKRGGSAIKVSLEDVSLFAKGRAAEVLAVDESLNRLAVKDARQAQVVELRFYGGLTVEETASVLKISPKTVKRDWNVARAWIYGQLKGRCGTYPGSMGPG